MTRHAAPSGRHESNAEWHVVVAACVLLAVGVGCRPAGPAIDYRSPSGAYTVQLVGPKTAPKVPLVEHIVSARAYKGATVLIDNREVHFADFFDSSFDSRFSGADWPAENVLRLRSAGATGARDRVPDDVVVLENNSGRDIRFLMIDAEDLFFAFDVPAGARLQLAARPQSPYTDLSRLLVGGTFVDGRQIRKAEFHFTLPERAAGAFRYVVDVRAEGVKVHESAQGAKPWSG